MTTTVPQAFRVWGDVLRIGHRTRRASTSGTIQSFTAALGLLALVLSGIAAAVTIAAYSMKTEHGAARTPYVSYQVETGDPSKAPGLNSIRGDWLADGMQFEIAIFARHPAGTPPPPGIPAWPAPGEVYLSPQLLADGGSEAIESRYGRLAGVIQPEGLTAVDERFAYVNPLPGTFPVESLHAFERLGQPVRPWWTDSLPSTGESGSVYSSLYVLLPLLALCVVPGVVLTYVARGVGADARRRRQLLMRVLGASPGQERLGRFGEIMAPAAVAVLGAVALVGVVLNVQFRVPLTGWLMPTEYLRSRWGLVLAGATCGLVLGLAILVLNRAQAARGATTVAARPGRSPKWMAVVTPVAFAAAFRIPSLVDPTGLGAWRLIYLACLVVALGASPFLLSFLIRWFGTLLEQTARARSWPSALIAARGVVTKPGAVLAAVAAVCIGSGLLFQVQFVSNSLNQRARTAVVLAEHLQGRLTTADFFYGIHNLDQIQRELGPSVELLTMATSKDVTTLRGNCDGLAAMGLKCESAPVDPRVHEMLAYTVISPAPSDRVITSVMATGTKPGTLTGPQRLIIVSREALDTAAVKASVIRNSWPNDGPTTPGFSYAGNAFSNAQQGLWISVFGVFGLLVVLITITTGTLGQFTNQAERLAPLIAFTGRHRPYWLISSLWLLVPVGLAGVTGAGLSLWVAQVPVAMRLAPPYGQGLVLAIVVATIALGLASTILGARVAVATARRWLPGRAR